MALGTDRTGVIAKVMRGAMKQTAMGLAIGIPVALLCVRYVKAQLYEVTSADTSVLSVSILYTGNCGMSGRIDSRAARSLNQPVSSLED